MNLHCIPFGEHVIVYRPLLRLAFLANEAMAGLARRGPGPARSAAEKQAIDFLEAIDFWAPDPEPPPEWRPSGAHRPTSAVLLMTSACNLRCTYCYAAAGSTPPVAMPLDRALRVIDEVHANARAAGAPEFELSFHGGGEPTLHWPTLVAAVTHARARDLPCRISLASNGVWTEEQTRFLLREIDEMSISLDGLPAIHDSQRPRVGGGGSAAAVLRTIAALDEAGRAYGVRITVTPASWPRLTEGIQFLCAQTRCSIFQVEPTYTDRRGQYADPSPEQARSFADAFIAAHRAAAAAGRTLFYSGARPWVIASAFCSAPESSLVVTPEGDVVTCFETHDKRHPLLEKFAIGRAEADGVEVDPSRIRDFAACQAERRATCTDCFCYWHCGGDCASRCMASPEPRRARCEANQAITAELLAGYIAQSGGVWTGQFPQHESAGGTP